MGRLWVIVRPNLAPGFRLAGVEAHGVEDIETAEELVSSWLDDGEAGLLAIDEGLLAGINRTILRRLESSNTQLHVPIPGQGPTSLEARRSARIARMIWRAVGFHIAFRSKAAEVTLEQRNSS
jgi:vacuolar-type H+-ATPase subunit F/Vma7